MSAPFKLLLCLFFLIASASGMQTLRVPVVLLPTTSYTVGPGTIISVHRLAVPFNKGRFVVTYQTDVGTIVEISHPGDGILLLKGMRGFLTYTMTPERIVDFRVVQAPAITSD